MIGKNVKNNVPTGESERTRKEIVPEESEEPLTDDPEEEEENNESEQESDSDPEN